MPIARAGVGGCESQHTPPRQKQIIIIFKKINP
jgi:hypothetical protein